MTRVFAPPSAIQPADVPLPLDDASDGLRSGAATPALGAGSGVVPTVGTAGEEIPVVYVSIQRERACRQGFELNILRSPVAEIWNTSFRR